MNSRQLRLGLSLLHLLVDYYIYDYRTRPECVYPRQQSLILCELRRPRFVCPRYARYAYIRSTPRSRNVPGHS